MNYEQTIAQAPGTNSELLKAALMSVAADIQRRLETIEALLNKDTETHGS